MKKRNVVLNLLGLLLAAPLLGYSLAHGVPGLVAQDAQSMLAGASVGLTLGVDKNPYNALAAELNEKEATLEEREAKLSHGSDQYGIYSLIMSAILLLLVAINFYMDMRRRRSPRQSSYLVNLR